MSNNDMPRDSNAECYPLPITDARELPWGQPVDGRDASEVAADQGYATEDEGDTSTDASGSIGVDTDFFGDSAPDTPPVDETGDHTDTEQLDRRTPWWSNLTEDRIQELYALPHSEAKEQLYGHLTKDREQPGNIYPNVTYVEYLLPDDVEKQAEVMCLLKRLNHGLFIDDDHLEEVRVRDLDPVDAIELSISKTAKTFEATIADPDHYIPVDAIQDQAQALGLPALPPLLVIDINKPLPPDTPSLQKRIYDRLFTDSVEGNRGRYFSFLHMGVVIKDGVKDPDRDMMQIAAHEIAGHGTEPWQHPFFRNGDNIYILPLLPDKVMPLHLSEARAAFLGTSIAELIRNDNNIANPGKPSLRTRSGILPELRPLPSKYYSSGYQMAAMNLELLINKDPEIIDCLINCDLPQLESRVNDLSPGLYGQLTYGPRDDFVINSGKVLRDILLDLYGISSGKPYNAKAMTADNKDRLPDIDGSSPSGARELFGNDYDIVRLTYHAMKSATVRNAERLKQRRLGNLAVAEVKVDH